jgi:hypothetical protein
VEVSTSAPDVQQASDPNDRSWSTGAGRIHPSPAIPDPGAQRRPRIESPTGRTKSRSRPLETAVNGLSAATLGTFYRGVTFDACMCTISQEPFSLLSTIVRLPVEISERLNSNVIMAVSPNRCSRTFSG